MPVRYLGKLRQPRLNRRPKRKDTVGESVRPGFPIHIHDPDGLRSSNTIFFYWKWLVQ